MGGLITYVSYVVGVDKIFNDIDKLVRPHFTLAVTFANSLTHWHSRDKAWDYEPDGTPQGSKGSSETGLHSLTGYE